MAAREDKLFRLIKSMNKAEKIFFKKFSTVYKKDTGSNYIKLFNAIDKQTIYDEAKLIAKFQKNKLSKYYSASKNYLYESILKSLKAFRQGKTGQSKVQLLKEDAQVLVEKGLYDEAYKTIQKAKKIAYEIEYYPVLLELLQLENSFVGFVVRLTKELNEQIKDEQLQIINTLENQHFFAWTYYEISYLSKNYQFARSPQDLEQLTALIRQPKFQELKFAKSHNARLHYCYANAIYQQLIGDHTQEWQFKQKMIELWEANPSLQKENQRYYIISLITYAHSCYSDNQQEELYQVLNRLKTIKPQTAALEEILFFNTTTIACYYAKLSLDFSAFKPVVNYFLGNIQYYSADKFTTQKRNTYLNLLDATIVQGDYDLAQKCAWELEQLPKTEVQQDAQYIAQLLSLVVYFKQENLELIESLCRSIEYKIKKDNKAYKYERLFLQLFRKLQNTPLLDYANVYTDFLQSFMELKANPFEQYAFQNFFDILGWLQAELQKTTMLVHYKNTKYTNPI